MEQQNITNGYRHFRPSFVSYAAALLFAAFLVGTGADSSNAKPFCSPEMKGFACCTNGLGSNGECNPESCPGLSGSDWVACEAGFDVASTKGNFNFESASKSDWRCADGSIPDAGLLKVFASQDWIKACLKFSTGANPKSCPAGQVKVKFGETEQAKKLSIYFYPPEVSEVEICVDTPAQQQCKLGSLADAKGKCQEVCPAGGVAYRPWPSTQCVCPDGQEMNKSGQCQIIQAVSCSPGSVWTTGGGSSSCTPSKTACESTPYPGYVWIPGIGLNPGTCCLVNQVTTKGEGEKKCCPDLTKPGPAGSFTCVCKYGIEPNSLGNCLPESKKACAPGLTKTRDGRCVCPGTNHGPRKKPGGGFTCEVRGSSGNKPDERGTAQTQKILSPKLDLPGQTTGSQPPPSTGGGFTTGGGRR